MNNAYANLVEQSHFPTVDKMISTWHKVMSA